MSVDTNGLVITDNKDVFAVCKAVDRAIRTLIIDQGPHMPIGGTYPYADFRISPFQALAVAQFKFEGEDQALLIYFGCDSNAKEYGEHSIFLTLEYRESSELIMRTVLDALRHLGQTYIDVNDSDDVDLALIPA